MTIDIERVRAREARLREREDLAISEDTAGQEYVYRPGECLVAQDDVALVHGALVERGCTPVDEQAVSGVMKYLVPAGVDIPALVRELRASSEFERTPRVGPNHVLFGSPRFLGWPGDDAEPADALGAPPSVSQTTLAGSGVSVAVIDTGLDSGARANAWLADVVADDPLDIDLTVDRFPQDGFIDDQAGHAAFIAGIIRQGAPGASVQIIKALDTGGVTDELTVARGIDRAGAAGADIINLSLGGYTAGDLPPVGLVAALERLPMGTVVVAAAGNLSQNRPMWPAALKRVVAVGAVDGSGRAAEFTNFGWWVDACALGVDLHSVYVTGHENPANDAHPDTFEGYALWSGTSFACASVSAAIAVEMGAGGGTARDAAHRLLTAAGASRVPELGVLVS